MSASRPFCPGPVLRIALGLILALCAGGAAHAQARVEGVEDEALHARIRAVLPDNGRPDNRAAARRMAREAADRVLTVLRSEGYYGAEAEPRAEGDESFEAVVLVRPGPRFTARSIDYLVGGGAAAETAALPQAGAPPSIAAGDPLVAENVLDEEAAAVARLRMAGYPDATPRPRRVVVDHATSDAVVEYNLDAGRPAVFGEMRIEGDARVRPRWAQRLVPFEPGESYEPRALETLSSRLSGPGAFDSVNVRLAPSQPGEGVEQRDVIVQVMQGDRHTIAAGAGYGTSDGVRLEGEWSRRNMFGGAETLTLSAVAGTLLRSARASLRAPHFGRPGRTVTGSVEGIQEDTDAYDRLAAIIAASAEQPLSRNFSAAIGAMFEQSRVEDFLTGRRDFTMASAFGEVRFDNTTDLLDPLSGVRASLRLEPGVATGTDDLVFIRAIANASTYRQISERIVLAARARAGTIFGAAADTLPADRRFYAGGGGSVRGYAYQSLGPRDALNNPLGGRSLLEAALEARFRVTERFGGVVFVDGGTTDRSSLPGFDELSFGAGAGIRYYTDFAPIRADIAVPLNKRPGDRGFQIYLSIGQAF